jgi:hypothetical protein
MREPGKQPIRDIPTPLSDFAGSIPLRSQIGAMRRLIDDVQELCAVLPGEAHPQSGPRIETPLGKHNEGAPWRAATGAIRDSRYISDRDIKQCSTRPIRKAQVHPRRLQARGCPEPPQLVAGDPRPRAGVRAWRVPRVVVAGGEEWVHRLDRD